MPSWGRFAAPGLAHYDRVDSGLLSGTALAAAPFTVPAGERWIVHALTVRWVSNATVGNRVVAYQLRDATDVVLLAQQNGVLQAATDNANHHFILGASRDAAIAGNTAGLRNVQQPLAVPLVIYEAQDLRILDASSIDGAGDTARAFLFFQRVKVQ